ncbi:hypothetical protein MED193_03467 [Roseobacter sp. MED193]|nr:hypothetical protein MED193_03467 [Roseobacter sp. MED193]
MWKPGANFLNFNQIEEILKKNPDPGG